MPQMSDLRETIPLPRWVVKIAGYLLLLLSLAAISTLFTVVLWIITLAHNTNKILKNQKEVEQSLKSQLQEQKEVADKAIILQDKIKRQLNTIQEEVKK